MKMITLVVVVVATLLISCEARPAEKTGNKKRYELHDDSWWNGNAAPWDYKKRDSKRYGGSDDAATWDSKKRSEKVKSDKRYTMLGGSYGAGYGARDDDTAQWDSKKRSQIVNKPAHDKRYTMLGGSYGAGYGARDDDTAPWGSKKRSQ